MKEIQAPNWFPRNKNAIKIFLAGSIEMNTAENWQKRLLDLCSELDVIFLNPRRDDWDNTITQDSSDPRFREQVEWELDGLNHSDIILFYFDPNTKSPVTLLELGKFVDSDEHIVLVCCPDGFWRKGNVDIVCERARIPVCKTFEDLYVKLLDIYYDCW